MKNDMLEYKGYYGSVQFSQEDECLVGKVEFIDDLILFDGTDVASITRAFREAVDDYLLTCEQAGDTPNVTWKGSLNVRLGAEVHKQAALEARRLGQTLNDFIKAAVQARLNTDSPSSAKFRYFAESVHAAIVSSGADRVPHIGFLTQHKAADAFAVTEHMAQLIKQMSNVQDNRNTLIGVESGLDWPLRHRHPAESESGAGDGTTWVRTH